MTRSMLSILLILAGPAGMAAEPGEDFWGIDLSSEAHGYPEPVPVKSVERAAEVPRLRTGEGLGAGVAQADPQGNAAVSVHITSYAEQRDLFGTDAGEDATFAVLGTRWENVHPKQEVSTASLQGKADRTMGVGGLSRGGRSGGSESFVEKDVAYKVPKLSDHVYLLADGTALPIDAATALLPGGTDRDSGFTIQKLGETKDLRFAFRVPEDVHNVALQLFDYANGNILIAVRGDPQLAGKPVLDGALDKVETEVVELAAHGLEFRETYAGEPAASGWHYAVVQIGGQSVSGSGGKGSILQFDPTKYVWVSTDGGYLYYAVAGSTDEKGNIRFTPEVYQQQEVAFRIPRDARDLAMGLRINRDVVDLSLTGRSPKGVPGASAQHVDGNVMEILLIGSRRDGDFLVLDLAVKPIVEGQGLELKTARQFLLQTAGGELQPDANGTAALPGHPPEPFVVPPGVSVRFELAYRTTEQADALRVRGFRSEGTLEL